MKAAAKDDLFIQDAVSGNNVFKMSANENDDAVRTLRDLAGNAIATVAAVQRPSREKEQVTTPRPHSYGHNYLGQVPTPRPHSYGARGSQPVSAWRWAGLSPSSGRCRAGAVRSGCRPANAAAVASAGTQMWLAPRPRVGRQLRASSWPPQLTCPERVRSGRHLDGPMPNYPPTPLPSRDHQVDHRQDHHHTLRCAQAMRRAHLLDGAVLS